MSPKRPSAALGRPDLQFRTLNYKKDGIWNGFNSERSLFVNELLRRFLGLGWTAAFTVLSFRL
jgi:hypothetical protein